jgi:hypothetical protein
VAQKVHQTDATLGKIDSQRIDTVAGAHVTKLFVAGVAAMVLPAPVLSSWRRLLAGAIASAALALWSSGAMALTNPCHGATGTSAVTNIPTLFYLQCMAAIQIPGFPLQSFGGSAFLRTNATTASYFLADRSNLGVDVLNGTNLNFIKTLTAKDGVGGFIGQLIWTAGPATTGTTRIGTVDEAHSGPNGMAAFTDHSGTQWMFVADGGCSFTHINGTATIATTGSAGTMGACGTPADLSTVSSAVNPNGTGASNLFTNANCNPLVGGNAGPNPPATTDCYPVQHQPNVKVFNLKTNTFAFSFPTGGPGLGGCPGPTCYASGNPPLEGQFGSSKAQEVVFATVSGTTYMLVSSPAEPFLVTGQSSTCAAVGTYKDSGATSSFPYLTLYTVGGSGSSPVVTYVATIKVDDSSPGPNVTSNGPFGCDGKGRRPGNPIGGFTFKEQSGLFFVALPNVLNNVPVDGSGVGLGQAQVPTGPASLGDEQASGCFYPQSSPPPANFIDQPNNPANGSYFWDCDGGVLVIDPTAIAAKAPLAVIGWDGNPNNPANSFVVPLGYCSPGFVGGGPTNNLNYDNVFLACSPRLNGNTAGTGSQPNIAETYSGVLNVHPNHFLNLPPNYVDPVTPFNATVAGINPNGATPPTPGCSVQTGGCTGTGTSQVNDGAIYGYPFAGTFFLNGATGARLNVSNFSHDPHWYVAVGGVGWSSSNIATLATKGPVIAYIDALSNELVEYTPTSSGSNTIALDEQNYVAFLPVNGVISPQLPAGDFTGNGVKLCGNGITSPTSGTVTGRGCVITFRQQYLSKAK